MKKGTLIVLVDVEESNRNLFEMFSKPSSYNFIPFPNVWEEKSIDNFFKPSYFKSDENNTAKEK